MDTALCALQQGNIFIGVLQETKLTGGIHIQFSSGYKLWATEAEIRHRGGIAIVWREEEVWEVEGARIFGPNVVSFTFVSGQKRWYVIRACVPPNYLPVVHQISHSLICGTEGVFKRLVRDLNACLAHPRDQREEYLATIIASHGLSDQAWNFTPIQSYQSEGNWTWRM